MKSYPYCAARLLLTGACFLLVTVNPSFAQAPKSAAPAVDPATHAAHLAAAANSPAPDATKVDPELVQQLSQLKAKVAQLEGALAKNAPLMAPAPAGSAMPGMPAAGPAMSMGNMKPGASMPGTTTPPPPMAGMSGAAAPAGGGMNMMGMMDKMMGMMDKMMGMGGGAMPMPAGGGGMGMDMDMMKMGGGAPMPAMPPMSPPAGMANMSSGGGMMSMMGMMGMGGDTMAAMPQSALPGFPGASHLYHLGSTGFFLDHPQHIVLTTEQQAGLNKAKEQATLAKTTADRAVEQAEQELWTLTASDQPNIAAIEAKLTAIGKLTSDERLAFIRAVGDASSLLTDEQRKILTGFAPPASAAPAAAPMAPMKDM